MESRRSIYDGQPVAWDEPGLDQRRVREQYPHHSEEVLRSHSYRYSESYQGFGWDMVDEPSEPLELSDLWLDADQGENGDGNAFGYVGTDENDIDDDGDECEYCGWFFDWPSAKAKITSEAERQAVIDSLSTDETARHLPEIPLELAQEKLETYLAKKFPGDLDESDE